MTKDKYGTKQPMVSDGPSWPSINAMWRALLAETKRKQEVRSAAIPSTLLKRNKNGWFRGVILLPYLAVLNGMLLELALFG
ncbi:hypothetical protein SLA2020_093360 [Shorea laevis]